VSKDRAQPHDALWRGRRMTLEQDIRRLSAIPLLAQLEVEALRLIAFSGETRTFRAGDVLFRQGEASDGAFIVMAGTIAVEATGAGRPPLQVVHPGALIGERALFSDIPRPATATAREAVTVLKITRTLFYRVLSEFPGSAERLRATLARSLAERLDAVTG
jgi:CRP-like cAMP-binding protein